MSPWFLPYGSSNQGDREKGGGGDNDNSPPSSGPGPLFFIYSKLAEEEDNKLAERWQQDADGILIFTGLFSAVVAQFLSISIPDLKPSPGTADPTFSPPGSAVATSLLWFWSLGISLTCAVMATMLQQWARQYVIITQAPRRPPESRARIRALFAGSIDKLFIRSLSVLLPCYLHLSILLFFTGLLVYLFNLNSIIFWGIFWWFAFCLGIYEFFTILPLFQSDSLLYTPVSSLLGSYLAFMFCIFVTILRFRFQYKLKLWRFFETLFGWLLREDVGKEAEKIAIKRSPEIDGRVLEETIDSLGEDDAMEKFFEAIPGYFEQLSTPIRDNDKEDERIRTKFKHALNSFLDRTLQSNTDTESVKSSRFIICLDASHAVLPPDETSRILTKAYDGRWPELLQSIEVGQSLGSWRHRNEQVFAQHVQGLIIRIIGRVQERNASWVSLVRAECHIPGPPENFCILWNSIIQEAQKSGAGSTPILVLKEIRHTYLTLHPGTGSAPAAFSSPTRYDDPILNQPSSYRLCNIAAHHSGPMVTLPPSSPFLFPTPNPSPPLPGRP